MKVKEEFCRLASAIFYKISAGMAYCYLHMLVLTNNYQNQIKQLQLNSH